MTAAEVTRRRMKEPFCAVSHYTGAVLSLVGMGLLLRAAQGHYWTTLAGVIYGLSSFALYLASGLSHTWHAAPKVQSWLSRFDYIGIFLLIAGSYAPLCLGPLRGAAGFRLLGLEYGLALLGILNVVFGDRTPHWWRVVVYVLMGWLIVGAWGPLTVALPPAARHWLITGGLCFTGGVAVLGTDRPHLWPGRFSAHDLWHLCVLSGSACHFYLIWKYIAPVG